MNLLLTLCLYAYAIYMVLFNSTVFMIFLGLFVVYMAIYIYLGKFPYNDFRRKTALATWEETKDPSCFLKLEFDITEIEPELKKFNDKHSTNLTLTHVCLKALSFAYIKIPRLNGRISFDRFVPFDGVHFSTLVNVNKKNLTNVLIENVDKKNLIEIRNSLNPLIKLQKQEKCEVEKQRMNLKFLPPWLFEIMFNIISFFSVIFGLSVKSLGIKKNQFGSCLFTNVSGLKVKDGWGSLVPFTKTSLIAALNEPTKVPKVINDQIVIRKICNLNFTFDHRMADGSIAVDLIESFKEMENNISKYLKESEISLKNN